MLQIVDITDDDVFWK